MKVLVTGATSGLGRNAVEFLRNKGISVRATGRNEAMGKLLQKMGAEFVHADLTELVAVALLQFYLPVGYPGSLRSRQRARHAPSGRMGRRLGRA